MGNDFLARLPGLMKKLVTAAREAGDSPAHEDRQVRVLYIEDDPGLARLTQRALERAGYAVDTAVDGEEGLRKFEDGQYDVLAVDQNMPNCDGLEVIRALAAKATLPPTIMVTGTGSEKIAVEAMKLGAKDYVVKDGENSYLALLPSIIERALAEQRLVIEREHALQALESSEQKYRELVEDIHEVIYATDANGVFTYISPAIEAVSGYSATELIGRELTTLVYEEDAPGVVQMLADAMKGELKTQEYRIVTKTGGQRWVQTNGHPLSEGGKAAGIHGVLTDITLRKEAEVDQHETNRQLQEALNELRQTQEQIVQQERLRALGSMASGIAHDFNNALAVILGFCELLLNRPKNLANPEKVKKHLHMMHSAAKDAAEVVSRLREFYRLRSDTEDLQPVGLDDIVREVVSMTTPRWKDEVQAKGIHIKVATDLQAPPPDSR